MFIIYDVAGNITGTISGPDESYGDVLNSQGRQWIFLQGAINIDPTRSYVDVATKEVKQNQPIYLEVNKAKFYGNGVDFSLIKGIPIGSNLNILCNGEPWSQIIAQDTELEFVTDQIATYEIYVTCARYIPNSITLQAIEAPLVPQLEGHSMSIPDYSDLGK